MCNDLRSLLFGQSVIHPLIQVVGNLRCLTVGNQRGDGHQTSVARSKVRAEPQIAEKDIRRVLYESSGHVPKLLLNSCRVALDSSMTIIVLTGYGNIPTTITAMKKGADYYLSKPADADQILSVYGTVRAAPGQAPEMPETVPTLARVEWEHMQRVIADCDGNISQAARLLGIHRRSLQRKLAKYPPAR